MVDDGSRDGSARIAAEFAARDPRVGVLTLPAHRRGSGPQRRSGRGARPVRALPRRRRTAVPRRAGGDHGPTERAGGDRAAERRGDRRPVERGRAGRAPARARPRRLVGGRHASGAGRPRRPRNRPRSRIRTRCRTRGRTRSGPRFRGRTRSRGRIRSWVRTRFRFRDLGITDALSTAVPRLFRRSFWVTHGLRFTDGPYEDVLPVARATLLAVDAGTLDALGRIRVRRRRRRTGNFAATPGRDHFAVVDAQRTAARRRPATIRGSRRPAPAICAPCATTPAGSAPGDRAGVHGAPGRRSVSTALPTSPLRERPRPVTPGRPRG